MEYSTFPIQNTIKSGIIQNSLNRILEMQKAKDIQFIDTTVMTPENIVDDMLDMLPKEVWNHKTRFLNIACKNGIYLVKIFERLFKALEKFEPNETKRAWYILENQIYAICIDSTVGNMLNTLLYGMNEKGKEHITWLNSSKDLQKLKGDTLKQYVYRRFIETGKIDKKETVKYMNFDVVIGNPPYNNDIYLDFVTLSKELITHKNKTGVERERESLQLSETGGIACLITPAKWQAKGGAKNEAFRRDIVPYMSKIVYYPNCSDVFEINDCSGICYYTICNEEHKLKEIINVCKHNDLLNSTEIRTLYTNDSIMNIGNNLLKKTVNEKILEFPIKTNRYCVYINTQVNPARGLENVYQALGMISYSTGKAQILGKYYVIDKLKNEKSNSGTCTLVFSSNSLDECNSFISYVYSKMIRMLIWANISTTTIVNKETWRFVPDPGAFDHIFTDQELYEKYNITEEEIKIIESVIKERK